MPATAKLERADTRPLVIHDLANGFNNSQLALKYGVSAAAVRKFRQRHSTDIGLRSTNLVTKLEREADVGWIADKGARLKKLEALYDETHENFIDEDGVKKAALAQAMRQILKDADEMFDQKTPQVVIQNNVEVAEPKDSAVAQLKDIVQALAESGLLDEILRPPPIDAEYTVNGNGNSNGTH